MSEALVYSLFFGVWIILLIWTQTRHQKQIQKAERQLYKMAQQAGGRDIVVWRESKRAQKSFFIRFVLLYVDVNGVKHKHRVSRRLDGLDRLKDDFFWDKPLQISDLTAEPLNLSSKEQIISEMAAQIKRLQKELDLARREN